MAEQNLENFNLIPPTPNDQIPSGDIMAGTPEDPSERSYEEIKDDLIVPGSDTAMGDYEIEGLENAVALSNMVASYVPNAGINPNPKDEDLNNNVFGKIIDDVRQEVSIQGKPNEVQPFRFSVKGSNFDRYYNSPQFQNLGFHPYADNESLYNSTSSWWDENARARSQFWNVFKTGFLSTYNSLGDLMEGKFMTPDMDEAEAYADAMRIGNSTQEGTGAFFNNLMLNSAYTVGIMSNIALEELALAGLEVATFGGATPLVASRTAYNAVRGGKAIDKMFNMGAYVDKSRKLLRNMNNVDFAKDFFANSGKFIGNAMTPNTLKALKSIKSVQGTAKAMSGAAKTAKTFGGMYRDFRAINLAMAESKLEGGMVKNDLIDELYAKFVDENGRAPTGEELSRIVRKADEAGFTTVMLNAPIIYLSNAFVFDTMLRGFGGAGKLMNRSKQGIFNRIVKKAVVKEGDKAFSYAGSAFDAFRKRGFSGNLGVFTGAALNYGRFNLVEGLQEIMQEGIAVGAKDYYRNLYNDPMAAGLDAIWASTKAGALSQMSGEGFEVFMSGFLMGGLVRGPQKAVFEGIPNLYKRQTDPEGYEQYQKDKEEYIKETVDILNKVYEDPAHYFDQTKLSSLNQKIINENLFAENFQDNVKEFMDEKDAGVFSHLHRIIESGNLYEYQDQMTDYLKLDDQSLAEAFPNATKEEIESGKTRERLQGMLDRIKEVEKAYKELNDKIINPFDPSEFKKGSKEYVDEVIALNAFNHAKMLALYTRDTFTRALQRSNQIYSELSEDPIVKKMAANDIGILADTQQLISEIRLLKIELRNTIEPTQEEGVELSSDEKVIYESKKKRLKALQDYFDVLTDPNNVRKYDIPVKETTEEGSDEYTTIIVGDAVKKIRQDILSTRNITDKEAEEQAIYGSGVANPFGEFDSANIENLREPVINYLNNISGQEKDAFMDHDQFDSLISKLVDYKGLKGRAEDYNKAIAILINPNSLYDLADKMKGYFKEAFMENKLAVKSRMEHYVSQAEKNQFLKELAEYGIYPEITQAEIFLKDGPAPYIYVTEDGPLTAEDNPKLEKKKDELLNIYLNKSKNTVQKEKTEQKEEKKSNEEYDPYNFEDTHFQKGEDTNDINESGIDNYTGNKYGDQFLVRKHKEYLLSRADKGGKGKTLVDHAEWLASPVSKRARVIEHAINRIHDEIYVREKLVGDTDNSFFNWVKTMKEDPRVSDILRSVDVEISDIVETEAVTTEDAKPTGKKYKVEKEKVRDRLTGDSETVYKVRDEKGNTVSDKVHVSKKAANDEKNILTDKSNKELVDNTPFEFAGAEYKKGDTLIDEEGNRYMVLSTPSMVDTYNNIYIKKHSKISSKNKKDKLFVEEKAFKAMNLEKDTALDYKRRGGKIKANEPLVITPVWDYDAANYLEKGVFEQQEFLRNLTENDKAKITFKITPGPKWFSAEETDLNDKDSFTEFKGGIENDLIKKHGQKWQVEVQLAGKTIGFFQGPTTLKLLNRKGQAINPIEITEAQVQDFFKIYKNDNIKNKTEQIRNNYAQAYFIYNQIDKLMEGKDIAEFTQEELGVRLNISEGSMAIAEEGDGVLFKELDHNNLNILNKEDLNNPEEAPYYFIDYNKIYKGDKNIAKEERSIITNIRPGTPSYIRLKEELIKYESKFKPVERLGKYVSFISMPNGKTAYVYVKPQTMTESEVTQLFNEWKDRSAETVEKNIDNEGKVITTGYNKSYNNKLAQKLFVSATDGVYLEMKLSENGDFRIDYSDLNVKKVKKGQKPQGIDRAKIVIPAKKFKSIDDIQDLLDIMNDKMFGKSSPLRDKNKVQLENFKRALPKDPKIDDLMNTVTVLDKEVKKNFNFSLSSTENINVVKRRMAQSEPVKALKTADKLSTREQRNAHLDDFSNVDPEILEDIARKQLDPNKTLTTLELKIAKFNEEILKGLRLKFATKAVNSVNTQGEAVNQKAVNSIQELGGLILERKKAIRRANREKFGKEKTNRELHELNKADIANDPELKLLSTKLKEAQSQANKITKNFDGHDIEDIETYIDWVKSRLGNKFTVDITNHGGNLKGAYKKVGMFMMNMKDISRGIEGLEGVITTGRNNPFKYHEAFHGVFRMLLTDAEIKKYLSIAKKEVKAKLRSEGKTLSEALNEMRKQHSMYAEMPQSILEERYYEEYLADEFENFKMNPSSTKTSSENKSMFQKIIDFIIEVLAGFRTRQLNHLFEGIDSGKYKNASIKENRFTNVFDGDPAFKLEILSNDKFITRVAEDGSSKIKQVKNYVPADQIHEITSGIANLYVQRLSKAESSQDTNIMMDETILDWIEMYNPDRDFYVDRGEWHDNNVDELDLLYNSLLDQTDQIRDLVDRHIKEFHAAADNMADTDFAEQNEKTTGDYDKSADMFGGYSSLPRRLRHIIATTTIEEVDRYGNRYINEETGEPIMISVNPHNVYNGLLKVLANTNNDLEMLQKAWVFGNNNPHTKAVVDRIFTQLGLYELGVSGELMKKDAEIPSQVTDSSLYMSFIKGMNKYRVDNIFLQTDKDTGITHMFAANKKDDAHHTVKQWAESFNRKYSNIKIVGTPQHEGTKDALMSLTSLLKLDKISEEFNVQEEANNISNDLKEFAGINLHPNYILYSIYNNLSDRLTEDQEMLYDAYAHVDPIEVESVSMIRRSIVLGENIYLDNQTVLSVDENEGTETEYEKGGVKGRLRKLALNNAEFDEAVGASTFIDTEGNRRHSHQDPTFHLEKIAEMQGAEYISEKLAGDVYLEKNMLLNNPQFKEMVLSGQVKPLRIVGSKTASLILGDLSLVEKRGGDVKNKGVSFGKSKPREFVLDLIHSYLYNYNRVSPNKTMTGSIDDKIFAIAPTFIRVLESSNTGDFVALPVQKMLDRNKEGIGLSDKAIKAFKNEIRIEFDRARRYYANEKEGIDNPYEGKERQGKLHTTYTLLTKLETIDRGIKASLPKIGKDQRAAITNNSQTVYLANTEAAVSSNLSQGETATVEVDGESFRMTNKGRKNISDFTTLEKMTLIERLGDSITELQEDNKRQFDINVDGNEYFVYNRETQKFFEGRQDLTIFEFTRLEEAEDVEITLDETTEGETIAEAKKKDLSAVQRIEDVAKNGILNEDGTPVDENELFNMVFDEVRGEELIKERLLDEVNEFILSLKEIKAYDKISSEIKQGLGQYKKIKDTQTAYDSSENDYWMEVYNLKNGDLDFNIAQIYLNNYINTKSFNQILLGDQALSLKNFVDAIKRAKMQNAAGPSAATEIYDETVGVMHKVDNISAIMFEDFEADRQFDQIYERDLSKANEAQSKTDGILYITEKGQRYLNFGFKGLTKGQAEILDDIKQGRTNKINNEFFGGRNALSHKQMDGIANSMKIVYGDGMTNLKMSATMLSKELTSVQDEQGRWIPREGREEMHNLREKMEREEDRAWGEGKGTIVMAVPTSSSKMMNMNVVKDNTTMTDTSNINPKNITDLSASSMRLQMINPSNKTEIVDARQMKNLITGEQSNTEVVTVNGKEVTIGDLRKMYHKSASDKLKTNYFAQRNLTFTFSGAMDALDKVKNINKFVSKNEAKKLKVDLHAFVKYAIAGLEASQAKTQMLSYFSVDEFGNPEYNLNAPMINQKMEQLFFSYFTKGVIASRQPGISAALVPDYGHLLVKQVKQVDEKGTPVDWVTIRSNEWETLRRDNPEKYKARRYADASSELHVNLKPGDFYLDRLRFNVMEYKDGKPTGQRYSEFMMPPHFRSQLENKVMWNQPLPDAIAKMFGIRIPSQDKHSAVNLKLVDYLPVYMGSSAMYARELIELSGADFDIDKLYMHMKSFFYDGKDFVEYGKVKNDKEGYKHYVRNVLDNATKGGPIRQALDRWLNKDSKTISTETATSIRAEDYKNMTQDERMLYHKQLTESNDKIVIDILDAVINGVSPEQKLTDALYNRTEGLAEALEMLGLPVTYDEYVAFKKANDREPYSAAIDNDLLDHKFGLLGHKGMTEPRKGRLKGLYFEPAVTTPLTDSQNNDGVWEWFKGEMGDALQVLGQNQRDIDSFLGMLESWANLKGGAEAIGTVVLPNTTSSVITEFKAKLRQGEGFNIPTMNGVKYNNFAVDYAIDHKTGKPDPISHRKQFIISALITQATDNAKNPLISQLNLNKKVLPTLVTMLSLGVDLKSAITLINNPSIKEAVFHSDNKDNPTDPGFKRLLEKRLTNINEVLVEDLKKAKQTRHTQVAVNLDNLITAAKEMKFDRAVDYETNGLSNIENPELNIEDLLLEKAILEQFIIFNDITETLNSATRLFNLQNGLGSKISEFEIFQKSAEELGLTLSNQEFEQTMIPVDLRNIFLGNNMHGTYYQVFRELYDDLTPLVMLKRTDKFVKLKDKVISNLDNSIYKLGSEQIEEINRDIVSYLTLKAYMVALSKDKFAGRTAASLQNSLIYDGHIYKNMDKEALSIKNVLDTIKMKLDKANKSNMFIDDFTRYMGAEHEDNKSGLMKLESNTWMQFSDSELTRVQNSILELLMLDDGTGDMYDNVMHLVHYLAVTKGMSFGDGSFVNVIPTVLVKDMLNTVDRVHELFLDPKEREGAYKSVFGMNLDEMTDELVRGYLKSKGTEFFLKGIRRVEEINPTKTEAIENIGEEIDVLTVDYEARESITNSKMLSNTAYRPFIFNGKQFGSVMHAFQVMKSGKFDEKLDAKYRKGSDKKNPLKNAEGKTIAGRLKRLPNAKSEAFFMTQLVEESILQNVNLTNEMGSLLPQILISAKDFSFPNQTQLTKATKKGLLNARENLVYIEKTEDQKADPLATRRFIDKRDVTDNELSNIKIFQKAPVFVSTPEKTLTVDAFRGIPIKYIQKIKGIRFLKGQGTNQKNIDLRNAHIEKLKKSGFKIKYVEIKIGDKVTLIPQIEFPAVIKVNKKFYELQSVSRDGAYKKEGDINNLIPSDSNIAFGNEAQYAEVDLEGSSTQTKIGFLFGNRPTHPEIVQFGKDKRIAFGEEIGVDQEQDAKDALSKLGITSAQETLTSEEKEAMYDEHGNDEYGQEEDFENIKNEDNAHELSQEDMLIDFYDNLTPEQQDKLATDQELQITSSKNVVSLLNKGFTADQIMELLKKCYI